MLSLKEKASLENALKNSSHSVFIDSYTTLQFGASGAEYWNHQLAHMNLAPIY